MFKICLIWVNIMADYKEMYLKMMRAAEAAMAVLIEAQRECEEMYLNSPEQEPKLIVLERSPEED